MRRSLLVVADRPAGDDADRGLTALLAWLRQAGQRPRLLVWDASDLGRLARFGPVREVEAVNRWRLPQWLERHGRHRAKRRLRHLRVRWWWLRWRRCHAAYLWGPLRPALRHYVPSDLPVVADLAGGGPPPPPAAPAPPDDLDEAPDTGVTVALADRVLVAHGVSPPPGEQPVTEVAPRSALAALDVAGPSRHRPLRRRLGLPADALVLASWGPAPREPLVGAERFLRLVWTVRDRRPDLDVHGAWFGGDERSRRHLPVTYERSLLGLDDVVRIVPEPVLARVGDELADVVDLVVLTHLGPARRWPTDRVAAAGVPVHRFDRTEVELGATEVATYPDVTGLAEAVAEGLDDVVAGRRDLDRILDGLGPS